MNLNDLCTVFPKSQDEWPPKALSGALPLHLRMKLKSRFGKIMAATDHSRRKAASRLGIAVRDFEPGDSLAALSRSHLLRTGEIKTRVDYAPGRQKAGILFHGYENMLFQSDGHVNKGQLGLGMAALTQLIHGSLSQEFEILCIKDDDFIRHISALRSKIKQWNFCYIATDLFFDQTDAVSAGRNIVTTLQEVGVARPLIFLTRDVREWVRNEPEPFNSLFLPFHSPGKSAQYFNGQEYESNLMNQYEDIQENLKSVEGEAIVVTGESTVVDVVETLYHHLTRRQHA